MKATPNERPHLSQIGLSDHEFNLSDTQSSRYRKNYNQQTKEKDIWVPQKSTVRPINNQPTQQQRPDSSPVEELEQDPADISKRGRRWDH